MSTSRPRSRGIGKPFPVVFEHRVRYHNSTMWLFAILSTFIIIPVAEVALFIQVGQAVGTVTTIVLVLAMGVLGSAMVRWQGLKTITGIKRELAEGRIPGNELIEGTLVLIAGALLVTPGFLTDMIGIFMLLPPGRTVVREAVKKIFRRKVANYQFIVGV